jgi:hypothetical protein
MIANQFFCIFAKKIIMAYSDFTFTKLKNKFGLEQEDIKLFDPILIVRCEPSQRLLDDVSEAEDMPLMSEKAKSESLIAPIIKEMKRRNKQISIYSGYTFNVDIPNELSGAPDFMISSKPKIVELQSPIFCLVESKNKTPDEGFAQCAAEMYAAQVYNLQNNEPVQAIYGTVTNAFDWIFLKLENNTIYIDKSRYFLNDLPLLIGILQKIIDSSVKK